MKLLLRKKKGSQDLDKIFREEEPTRIRPNNPNGTKIWIKYCPNKTGKKYSISVFEPHLATN